MFISDIKVEHIDRPIGLDVERPRFSYIINSDTDNTVQTEYRITVKKGRNAVWRCRRKSSQSVLIQYAGEPLEKCTRYSVEITVRDNHGQRAEGKTWFETGLMGDFEGADFITYPQVRPSFCPVFTKSFGARGGIKRARLYITALGLYMAHINGKRVGGDYFTPGNTDYNYRLQYQAYDVTDMLARENRIEVTLAPGWYSGPFGCVNKAAVYGDRNALWCRLLIEYGDGTSQFVSSDETWEYGTGHILFSEREAGEDQDTRRGYEPEGSAVTLQYDKGRMTGCVSPAVRIIQQLPAQKLIITPSGKKVLDFGQNLSGFVRFNVRKKAGSKIVLRHCEVFDQDGEIYTANLRTARCTDTYITNGKKQTLMPHFTFHGFRYCQVEGIDDVRCEDFTACVLHTDMEQTGEFECSEKDINQLQHNILWGQKGNFTDIPTDCPQRDERLGWTGDAQVFAPTAAFNMDVSAFFTKWLADLAAEQSMEKGVPHMVPDLFGANGAAAWGDAATVIPTVMYQVYGDKGLLEKQYPSMKAWVDYILSRSENYLWMKDFQYGDWLGMDREGESWTGATDPNLVANAYFAYSASLVADAARALGKKEDAHYYSGISAKVKKAFRKEYITPNGRLVSDTQTACTIALRFDLAEPKDRDRIMQSLTENLKRHNDHMVTGFVGTPQLCFCLSENGRHDLAAKLLMQRDYPSWLYSVDMGATTIWERWNGIKPDGSFETADMNSFNHYAYGSVGDWLYRCVAGLAPEKPGYKRISMKPTPTDGMDYARARLKTVYGIAECGWRRTEDGITVECTVPCNASAALVLPLSGRTVELGSGKYCFEDKAVQG